MTRSKVSRNKALKKAANIISWYVEGSDLNEEETHLIHDCASEHCQILDNVVSTSWFLEALAENIQALENTP